ncbi:MAG: penicillin-binding protein 2 [Candidatus Melainabacteria bacterium]|jgi:penicillin-binding protein 2|nr:penicillin-binding protein 2 [Candidatus Melainabacteria bacterium]
MQEPIVAEYNYSLKPKVFVLLMVIVLSMAALLARLTWLQIIEGNYYKNKAIENSTRVTFLRAPRGNIYDCHGNLLATNKQSISMIAIPAQLTDIPNLARLLSKILDSPYPKVYQTLLKAQASGSVLPVVIERDLDVALVSRFYEKKLFLPGIDILPDISRSYPNGEIAAHVLGYCGEITESQLKRRPNRKMGDVVGQDGIERLYDDQLRGVDGEQRVRVNAMGQSLSAETSKPQVTKKPTAGKSLVISLDLDLQKAAYDALGDRSGAIVAIDAQNGEVLAMVSRPSFDPNDFTRKITPQVWKKLNAPNHPLFNRALSGFPPGSIWKAITLLAALECKAVKPDTKLHVSGGISLGGFFFGDWTGTTGLYDLVKCLAWSRDSAFYQMALKMKPEQIKEWAVKFGAARPTGVELRHESKGLVPDSAWKLKYMHEKWYPGNTLHMSIGQTYVQVTPTQAARIYAGLGNKGKVPNLHFVKKIGDRLIPPPAPEMVKTNPVYLKVVLDGLKAVVASGTGGATRLGNVEVAGKTGSAEAPPAGSRTHAWFACYAPADNPQIAISCFVEHGGHGGTAAAPLAKAILEKYFATNPVAKAKPEVQKQDVPAKKRSKPKSRTN